MYPDGQHILVIDNEGERRQRCERILLDAGFAVTAVSDGVSAIRAAAQRSFPLAVAAMDLPGTLDGPTTVRQIRSRQPWLKTLFTGSVAQRPFVPGRTGDDFIPSPFHLRDLLGCVFELLHREVGPAALAAALGRRAG